MKKRLRRKNTYFKPIHFVLLAAIDSIVLAAVIIPQRSNINEATELLTAQQQELNDIKIEFEREQTNLEYMKTPDYKLQQGAIKYGWHYEDDTMIPDED